MKNHPARVSSIEARRNRKNTPLTPLSALRIKKAVFHGETVEMLITNLKSSI
jgi:hypothetical protein